MWDYYKRFGRVLWKGFKAATAEQIIGVLLAIAILVCQIILGVIHREDVRANERSIAWPYVVLVLGLFIWQLIKTPYKLDQRNREESARISRHSQDEIAEAQETIKDLHAELIALKEKLFDERPFLGLRVDKYVDQENPLIKNDAVSPTIGFYFCHLRGRPATSITVDPIYSYGGRFSLRIRGLSFLAQHADVGRGFEIWEDDNPPLQKVIEHIGWTSMLSSFVFDKPDGRPILEYPVTVRLKDLIDVRIQEFTLLFDVANFRFGVK